MDSSANVKTILSTAFPQFQGESIVPFDEGWDFHLYELESGWLFRFPKRHESIIKLEVECRLLPELAPELALPIPTYQRINGLFGEPGPPFAGYEKLPGIPGDRVEHVDRSAVAEQMGVFLRQLHNLPNALARAAGVVEMTDLVTRWRARALTQLTTLPDLTLDTSVLHQYLDQSLPSPFKSDPALIHNDLWAEHILIDPSSGRVSGIIDWGDVAISDPHVDFAFLLPWFGKPWLRLVIKHYDEQPDFIDMHRVSYLSTCLAVHNITLGQELGRPSWIKAGEKALEWIHNN